MPKGAPEPTWARRWREATSPDQQLAVAYDAIRATVNRCRRKRTTLRFERGSMARNADARHYQREGADAADELARVAAETLYQLAVSAWGEDGDRTWSSGHRGQAPPWRQTG